MNRAPRLQIVLLSIGALALGACAQGEDFHGNSPVDAAATGGAGGTSTATGGTSGGASGGATATGSGGAVSASGGALGSTGGATSTGGASNTGGKVGTGGATSTGGKVGTGGAGGTQVSGATLLKDDFEDGTPDGWIQDPGDTEGKWAIAADGASKTFQESVASSKLSWMVGGNVAWRDQHIEAKVKFTSFSDSSASIFLASRFQDFDNYYWVFLKVDGSMKIRRRVSATTADVVTYKSGKAVTAGSTHTIGMSLKGTDAAIYLDGVMVATATDPAGGLASGGIALGAQYVVSSFDDVVVTVP